MLLSCGFCYSFGEYSFGDFASDFFKINIICIVLIVVHIQYFCSAFLKKYYVLGTSYAIIEHI